MENIVLNWDRITFLMMLIVPLFLFLLMRRKIKQVNLPPNIKTVPVVEDGLPFVGHGPAFSKDIIGFISRCYEKYGKIFRLKIFKVNMVVICDRTLNNEFFKATEESLSLYHVLTRLHFADAFSDQPDFLPQIINVIKKSIAVRYDTFIPKIEKEAMRMIERLRITSEGCHKVDLITEMTRFVATTSASCFMCLELTDSVFEVLLKYTNFVNTAVVLTYFFPKWLLRLIINPFMARLRKRITKFFEPEIEKYRKDLYKTDSLVLRTAVDYLDVETQKGLNNQEIGDIVVSLLYVSSENTALGLTNTVTDLACNSQYWESCKGEAALYLRKGDIKSLFASPLINACVMESARLNAHIFALNRKPLDLTATIGGYFVGDADSIAMCEPMLQVHGSAQEIFSDPTKYNPNRFLGQRKEGMGSYNVMTWGAGIHHCPGKMFSIYEIKMALALILTNFELQLDPDSISKINYFSPSAFAERKVQASLKVLCQEDLSANQLRSRSNIMLVHGHKVEHFPEGGWLLRDFINRDDQVYLYQYIFNISKDSAEHREISSIPLVKAYPFAYHNLVYTGKSNCPPPESWYKWAQQVWELLYNNKEITGFAGPTNCRFNSLYAQLYGVGGSMKMHKDEHVSWGISVSLGASATFVFGSEKIILHSGDVFIADFSKVEHGVESIQDTSMPDWFSKDSGLIETYGRVRCSIQIRDISEAKSFQGLTTEEFKQLIK